jgi:hypothetical protein
VVVEVLVADGVVEMVEVMVAENQLISSIEHERLAEDNARWLKEVLRHQFLIIIRLSLYQSS